ncbi:MAG: hypothetical protein FJY65_09475 [Calditrichaeota bacterium]|nr:hypothetical protein [Calditrichota bacterium]
MPNRKLSLVALMLALLPLTSFAEWVDEIVIQPDQPRMDEAVTTVIRGNFPDNRTGWFDQTFTREDNVLLIVLRAATEPGVGLPVIIPWEVEHDWGRLAPQAYRVFVQYYIRRPNQVAFTLLGELQRDFRVEGEFVAEHRIPLDPDRPNIISSPIIPENNQIPTIFRDIVDRGNLLLVKDARGRFYSPRLGFNNIPVWDYRQSYYVKVCRSDTLVLRGRMADEGVAIPLAIGWNGAAYLPEREIDAPTAFLNIRNNLLMAKDASGNFYVPRLNFNNIPPLRRGQGYLVKVDRAVDLVWNRP